LHHRARSADLQQRRGSCAGFEKNAVVFFGFSFPVTDQLSLLVQLDVSFAETFEPYFRFLFRGFFVQTPIIPIRFSWDLEFKLQPAQHD
jgi:hypothetical protein